MMKTAGLVALLLLAAPVLAQEAPTIESLSQIREFEAAELDGQSIRGEGELTRFDVRVRWRSADQRPPGAPAARYIRYVAKCPENEKRIIRFVGEGEASAGSTVFITCTGE